MPPPASEVLRPTPAPMPAVLPPAEAPFDDPFPVPEGLRSAVAFWTRVYLEVTTDGGLLHDSVHLGLVYEVVRFEGEKNSRRRQKIIDGRRKRWKEALRRLSTGATPAEGWETTIVDVLHSELGRPPTAQDFSRAARRVRFQLGQRDKFRQGIVRSGAWEDAMRDAFVSAGLPGDLAHLPHVESSFNVRAYSKYGAAGVWQFMRSTGRRYMTVDYVVDERLDPMVSTRAATQLLGQNYKALQSWPLAVTAYNHGRAGMSRAKRKLGTDDLGVIAKKYKSRTFGFASRNFYAQFLAARGILKAYEPFFGALARDSPEAVDSIKMPFYADVEDLQTHLGLAPDVIGAYNPALRPPVFRSGKRIPKDYTLRLPAGTLGADPTTWLHAIPAGQRFAKQHRSRYYQVRRGDTLSRIAKRQRTRVSTLVAINNLSSRHRIYPGQVLTLPDAGEGKPAKKRKFEVVRSAHAAVPKPEKKAEPAPNRAPAPSPSPSPSPKVDPERVKPLTEPTPGVSADSPWRRVDRDRVIVDSLETLGHFADWLRVPTQRLRKLNGIRSGRSLHMGQRLKLDFSRVRPEEFLEKRMEFHKGIEEDFFGAYRVAGTVDHTLKRGESLWELSHRVYGVPSWLIRRYNPDVDLTRLSPGVKLVVPVVKPASS